MVVRVEDDAFARQRAASLHKRASERCTRAAGAGHADDKARIAILPPLAVVGVLESLASLQIAPSKLDTAWWFARPGN